MGIDNDTPPAHPHDRAGRRHLARRAALDIFASGLPPAGAGAGRAVPPPVPHPADRAPCGRTTCLLRHPGRSGRPPPFPASPRCSQEEAVGRLCQATVRRPRGRARLSLALHSSGRHLEPASDRVRQDRHHLPLQGLPPRWYRAAARHDARAARVHPPLPAPCPATRLSPHPALRLPRQFSTQGRYCACPRTAGRRTAAGACRSATTTRSAPALSLLRRPNDHHRDLRTMETTPRATSSGRTNRERPVVTRHGLRPPHAATPKFRPMTTDTPFDKIVANAPKSSSGPIPIQRPRGAKPHSPRPCRQLRCPRPAIITPGQKPKSP